MTPSFDDKKNTVWYTISIRKILFVIMYTYFCIVIQQSYFLLICQKKKGGLYVFGRIDEKGY